jgi:hypothetical protein
MLSVTLTGGNGTANIANDLLSAIAFLKKIERLMAGVRNPVSPQEQSRGTTGNSPPIQGVLPKRASTFRRPFF